MLCPNLGDPETDYSQATLLKTQSLPGTALSLSPTKSDFLLQTPATSMMASSQVTLSHHVDSTAVECFCPSRKFYWTELGTSPALAFRVSRHDKIKYKQYVHTLDCVLVRKFIIVCMSSSKLESWIERIQ